MKFLLEGELVEKAEAAQMEAMEEDERKGLVEEYLNTKLPANWDEMDLYQRRNFLSERGGPMVPEGTVERKEVSNLEIWAECFSRNIADMRPADSYAIAALMTQINGWKRTGKRMKLPIYGKQRMYVRNEQSEGK